MKDWISYLEKYRCDRVLLDIHIKEIDSSVNLSDRERLLKAATVLEQSVKEAETKLDHYISEDADPREVLRLADEKLFLSYRYICGMTMIETAYAMCVSKDTVYRIRRRVLSRPFPG